MKCTVCQHPQHQEIDRALLSQATLTSLAQKYGLSISALFRHKDHLRARITQARQALVKNLAEDRFVKLHYLLEKAMDRVAALKDSDDFAKTLQGLHQVARLLKLLQEFSLRLEDVSVYNNLLDPLLLQAPAGISTSPETYRDARWALSQYFNAICSHES